jgi:peptide/nickel transport system substrate-binding protein
VRAGDYADLEAIEAPDPETVVMRLSKFISRDLSPNNSSRAIDRTLDDLFGRQRRERDPAERRTLIRTFERRVLTEAYMVPTLWAHRIVATSVNLHGWSMTPTRFVDQSLAAVWLAK